MDVDRDVSTAYCLCSSSDYVPFNSKFFASLELFVCIVLIEKLYFIFHVYSLAWLISFPSFRDFQGISYCFVMPFSLIKVSISVSWFSVYSYLRKKYNRL